MGSGTWLLLLCTLVLLEGMIVISIATKDITVQCN